ncbi:RfaG Glycosyltransferase [Fimbriimonadaceae bacterium]
MPKPLRIAVFSDSALPLINGVSVSVAALVEELRDRGHDVDLYANRFPGFVETHPNNVRFNAVEIPFWRGYPVTMPPLATQLRRFRERTYDIVHTHTPFPVGMIGLRWAESHELPIVSTYHTLYDRYSHYVKILPPRFVRYRIARHTNYYYSRVHHVITPSEASLKWLRRHDVHTRATIIPTGSPVPKRQNPEELRAKFGVSPTDVVLLYAGRLAPEKNLRLLIEAVSDLMAQRPEVQLWLMGDGPYRATCEELVDQLGIRARVKFFGFVSQPSVGDVYGAADLFVFASVTETQGLVVQEAMLHRLPVVVVSGGGASETIIDGHNGLLARNDRMDFCQKMNEVLSSNETRQQLAEAGFHSQLPRSIPAMVDRVLAVYREVISEFPSSEANLDP